MPTPTVLIFGSVNHPVLTALYHFLLERNRQRVVYLANEIFPRQPSFFYQLSGDGQNGRLILEDGTQVEWEDIIATALDGYYIVPPDLELFSPKDQEYLQTESWAALIALFEGLAKRGPVANHILQRDVVASRLATLAYLASHGVPIPPVCVTSDPDQAREFVEQSGGAAVFRPINGKEVPFRQWDAQSAERLERLPLCPVHFEARREGAPSQLLKVGNRWLATAAEPPEPVMSALQRAMDGLNLHLGEAHLVQTEDGQWTCLDLKPFVGPTVLSEPQTADWLASYFEEGGRQ